MRLLAAASRVALSSIISSIAFSVGIWLGEIVRGRFVAPRSLFQRQPRQQRPASSLKTPGRTFVVVTTAALPWRTGTSINPLLRAAHLAAEAGAAAVALVVPFVSLEQQPLLYPSGVTFDSHDAQAAYILDEARKRTGLPCKFRVLFYDGRYFPSFGSIFPTSDIITVIPREMRDVAILEEPEHLCWFQHSTRWSSAFAHCIGIMHTNYLAYVREGQKTGFLNAAAVYRVNRWVCRLHCTKVIKLSDAVQNLPHQVTCNVHGVAGTFLQVGRAKAAKMPPGEHRFQKGAYFIGKAVWGKGYRELINLGAAYEAARPDPLVLDVVGAGEDLGAIQEYAAAKGLHWRWLGAKDHADPSMHAYQAFLNPSTSDVVATTTAEALAMGKWVVVPDIPCNAFFKQFSNCLTYTDERGFAAALDRALLNEPRPMTEADLRKLSWEAATQRLLDVGSIAAREWPSTAEQRYTAALWRMYRSIVGFTALREALGMTSASGEDEEPLVGDSDEDEEEAAAAAADASRAGSPPVGLLPASPRTPPRAPGGVASASQTPRRTPAERAAAAQQELAAARTMGAGAEGDDWELDWGSFSAPQQAHPTVSE